MNKISSSPYPSRLRWLAVAAVVGADLGWFSRPQPVTDKNPTPAADPVPPAQALAARPWLERTLDDLNAGTLAQQLHAALQLAELGSVEEIRTLLDRSHAFPKNAAAALAVNGLLRRWLNLDAASALAYANLRHQEDWPGLLAAYAALHPAEAEAYWRAIPIGAAKTKAWDGLCDGLISRHPAEAWRLLKEESDRTSKKVAKKLAALDVEDTLARLDSLPEGWKGLMRKIIAAELMKQDPARAMAWIESQPEKRELIAEAAAVAYRKDPAKAFGLLAGLSDLDRNIALGNMTSPREYRFSYPGLELPQAGTGQDRTALAAAVMNSPLNVEDRTNLLNHFFWQDPGRGQAFWEHFSEKAQLGKLPAYLYRWSAVDKAAAEAWWKGLPAGLVRAAAETQWQELEANWNQQGGTAGRLLIAIRGGVYPEKEDPRLAGLTPHDLSSLASAIGEPNYFRIGTLAHVVRTANPETAASWLETAPLTDGHLSSAADFCARWALDDPPAAADWAGRLPEGKLAVTAAYNIARQYQVYAPEAARKWVEGLTQKSVREAARKGLLADREMDSE